MDLTQSIAPRSDQLNADDLISGPITVTITDVREGAAEQPVDVILAEYPGRAYRPSKSMRRIIVMAWGSKSAAYTGHRLTLFRNPEITFGRDKVGGIEIAAMSHIAKPLTVALTATRGKRKNFTVQPLPDAQAPKPSPTATRDFRTEAAALTGNVDGLRALYMDAQAAGADPETLAHIKERATV